MIAEGAIYEGQCDVGDWTDITQVAAGWYHTVGLKFDNTVVAVGDNSSGQCNVGGWTNITQVTAGSHHTVGLKSDDTVVAVGWNQLGQCNDGGWMNNTPDSAGPNHTVGLKFDGTMVAVGGNSSGECDIEAWTDIIQVACGESHTVGIKSNGTVVAVGGTVWDEPSSGICFIATAAYGAPMAEDIQVLRDFRDKYLLTNPLGQALVGIYYRVSQPMAEFIAEHTSLKPIVRAGLLPAVALSALVVNTTPVQKAIILALLVLVSVVPAIWAKRRRGRDPLYT